MEPPEGTAGQADPGAGAVLHGGAAMARPLLQESAAERDPLQGLQPLPPSGACGEVGMGARPDSAFEGAARLCVLESSCRLPAPRLLIQSQVAGAEAACGVSKILYFTFDILFGSIRIP